MCLPARFRYRHAFTLIELLVVISIIVLLAALAAPAISGALTRGETAKCAANLHEIGAGFMNFASDHNGELPIAGAVIPHSNGGGTGEPGLTESWTEQLEPYMGNSTNADVYRCPASAKVIPANKKYGYFYGSSAAYLATGSFGPVYSQRIQYPSRYILGGDISAGMFTVDDADKDDYSQDPAFDRTPAPFHNGSVNILFADGSVRAFKKWDPQAMCLDYDGAVTNFEK